VAKPLHALVENFAALEFSLLSPSDAIKVFQRHDAMLTGDLTYSKSIFRSHFFNTAWLQDSIILVAILDADGTQGLGYFILFSNW
jgi:hypothetical protein